MAPSLSSAVASLRNSAALGQTWSAKAIQSSTSPSACKVQTHWQRSFSNFVSKDNVSIFRRSASLRYDSTFVAEGRLSEAEINQSSVHGRRIGEERQLRGKGCRAMSTEGASASESSEAKPSVGWLGLGIMGTAMMRNLLKAGYDVTVWNRTVSKAEGMVQEGAKLGRSPAQVVRDCDITFAMLADPAAALAAALGEDGAVSGVTAGKGYVDVSTVDGATAQKIADAVRKAGGQFLEAPVSGSKKPAEDGTLIFLTAGDKPLYERSSAALDVMGKAKFFLGDVGQGANMKLVVNMVMGSMLASFSEGLLLGQKAGLDANTILEVVSLGAINAPLYSMKGPTMLKQSYAPAFPLKHQQKDLRLALELAEEVGQPMPVATAANALYEKARDAGLGDSDFSAVLEALKERRKAEGH